MSGRPLCLVLPFGPCNAVYSGRLGTHVVIIAIAMAIIINMVVGSGAVGGAGVVQWVEQRRCRGVVLVVIVDPQLSMLMNLGCMANEVEPQLEPREARKKRLQIYSILPRWHVCGWMVFGKFCKFCLPNCVHVCGCVCMWLCVGVCGQFCNC